ncbi:Alpha-(1-_3)-arabinofuranosyltransferase [Nocardioides dokdonensis FR1436]|uniref:Alpha-(1->3)-arabinofuranosyltransferase n=1 Tax=Nocardioides dokdonensis FR1436 TaxID=1300347 RepID=A0A1A9GP12_9ACTN|nr:alpha-(1->3)-arabinofuranosyltransferase family protein [Nocardioides dokdonensis]ANH40067.1 Alpha-(1->3)-arabinofuranosyltransferase [Nocardioides dokdonensis FR1436]
MSAAGVATAPSGFGLRVLAGCALLVGLAFIQDPGLLVADTKFDLVAAPGDFLARALHLWDGEGALGQLQNQAYGYLWPMGGFFWLGAVASVPGWVVQRLWWGLVLAVAFSGTARLTRALGVRSDLACLVAGMAFALSPRVLSTMGPISSETWPVALAPWVLLRLVTGSERGSPRRAAALSALAVSLVGGVNAAASFAVIPLGALWLLTRTPGPRRRSLMLWWPTFTLLGTLWWLVPLALMGSYSPPFLDYIESASVTTFPTTLVDALRGTSNWVPYVEPGARAGRDLLTTSYLALNSAVVLALGLAGLMLRSNPHRRFLGLGLLVGLLMVTAGHLGAVQGWFAPTLQVQLDGVLSPLRNVHKFDPVLRLPLVIGLALSLDALVRAGRREADRAPDPRTRRLVRLNTATALAVTVAVVAGAAAPALAGRIAPAGAVLEVPPYWSEAADWLDEQEEASGDATALLVPGSNFARYLWGAPDDEPMQWLADSRWAVRNVVPLVPPGSIRSLDGIEARLSQGHGSPGLAAALRRAGLRYLVVRGDLERTDGAPDPVLVRQALRDSPGVSPVAGFGPLLGGVAHLEPDTGGRVSVAGGWQTTYRAIEVWEVAAAAPVVEADVTAVVAAGPEDLADLADTSALDDRPVVLAADAPVELPAQLASAPVVLTDGLRARERSFARIHDGSSAVLVEGDVRRTGNPVRDYLIDTEDRWSTTARLVGARSLSASSSASDADSLGFLERGASPWAALDGANDSAWVSRPGFTGTAWWRLDLDTPVAPSTVRLVGGPTAAADQRLVVRTDAGTSQPVAVGPGESRTVPLDVAGTSFVEVRSLDADRDISIAEVRIPGVQVRRPLVLPLLPEAWGPPDAVVLRADKDRRTGCVEVEDLAAERTEVRCVARRVVQAEEPTGLDRVVRLAGPADFSELSVRVRPRASNALEALVLEGRAVGVQASSTAVPDPRASALAALDGDLGTTWVADPDDPSPSLQVSWLGRERVTSLRLRTDADAAAAAPTRLRLTWDEGSLDVDLDDGRARLPGIRTDALRLEVLESENVTDLGFDGVAHPVGVGIGELRLGGVPYEPLRLSSDQRRYACGTGPTLRIGRTTWRTRLMASPAQLAAGASTEAVPCGAGAGPSLRRLRLPAGETEVRVQDTAAVEIESVVLGAMPTPAPGAASDAPLALTREPAARVVAAPSTDAVLVVSRENANPGWQGEQDGQPAEPVVVDGWQQGWLLPADAQGPLALRFGPDRVYRLGLLAGALTLLGLLVVVGVSLSPRGRATGAALPPLAAREVRPATAAVTAVLGAGLLAGWWGALVAGATVGLVALLRRRAPGGEPWLFAAPVLAATAAYAARPWGDPDGWAGTLAWPVYLALVPVAAVLLSAGARPRRRSGWTAFRRSVGRSTSR